MKRVLLAGLAFGLTACVDSAKNPNVDELQQMFPPMTQCTFIIMQGGMSRHGNWHALVGDKLVEGRFYCNLYDCYYRIDR